MNLWCTPLWYIFCIRADAAGINIRPRNSPAYLHTCTVFRGSRGAPFTWSPTRPPEDYTRHSMCAEVWHVYGKSVANRYFFQLHYSRPWWHIWFCGRAWNMARVYKNAYGWGKCYPIRIIIRERNKPLAGVITIEQLLILSTDKFIFNIFFTIQDVDMVLTGLTISAQREAVVDFSYPFWEESVGLLTLTEHQDEFYIIKPLKFSVWLSLMGTALLAALFAGVLETKSWKSKPADPKKLIKNFTKYLWYTFGAIWYQGWLINEMISHFVDNMCVSPLRR